MDLRPRAILRRFRGKALKFVAVSLISTVITQTLLYVFGAKLDWRPWVANVVAVTFVSCISYTLNRYWVWERRDKTSLHKEALPYWGINLAGLAISTVFAIGAEQVSDEWWIANVANIAGFGVLWLAKFLILDEYLFKTTPAPVADDRLEPVA